MVRVPTDGAPTHPGEMLEEEFLKPLGLSQTELAAKLGVSYPRVNELVHGKRGVTSGWRRSSGSTSSWRGTSTTRSVRQPPGAFGASAESGASPRRRCSTRHAPLT